MCHVEKREKEHLIEFYKMYQDLMKFWQTEKNINSFFKVLKPVFISFMLLFLMNMTGIYAIYTYVMDRISTIQNSSHFFVLLFFTVIRKIKHF